MQKTERIAQLLANRVPASDITSIVGCSEAYLKRLAEDESFRTLVAQYSAEEAETSKDEENERLDDRYIGLEHRLLKNLTSNAAMMEPKEAIGLLRVVSERNDRKRHAHQPGLGQGAAVHVHINMPAHAMQHPEFQINSQKEVVAVGDRALAPMSMDGVAALIEESRERYAPTSSPSKSAARMKPVDYADISPDEL